ncbi:GNAT family N-acetyltransferase [Streptomyces sp. NRRL S-87]|uniref:GNAT family N-acetyltransferase n=1 Tax=Streptomyces sp. NRRL S-87 TaxID=1463920 RepID=UPI000A5B049A|nr:GNAT family N-acetyltransferase [Streptomyces sp. NRRL S-87]
MILVRAEEADLPRLIKFRTDAAAWLAQRGSDQWAKPFPASHILDSIRRGEVYLVRQHLVGDALATITVDRDADPQLWTPEERRAPAFYVHKLAVDRTAAPAGLGTRLLNWAGDYAARHGADWLRLDAWTTNDRLHRYYLDHGFAHVRTATDPGVVSGWAAQRSAALHASHGFMPAWVPAAGDGEDSAQRSHSAVPSRPAR